MTVIKDSIYLKGFFLMEKNLILQLQVFGIVKSKLGVF